MAIPARSRQSCFVERDVHRVRQHAAHIITLSPLGATVRTNPNPLMRSIAVVGSGEYRGTKYDEAVLLEIGMQRGRPYAPAENSCGERKSDRVRVPRRRKWFAL